MPEDTSDKKVDDEWKQQLQEEKQHLSDKTQPGQAGRTAPPEATLLTLISGLASQALIGIGQIADPISSKQEIDLDNAKFAIDTLQMHQEKTKGNLTDDEKSQLESIRYDLRMRFLDAAS